MKVAILLASSQSDKSSVIEKALIKATNNKNIEIINLVDDIPSNYLQVAIASSALLTYHAIDFVVTGCSSGNGMMLACNSLPNVFCGYASTPIEAALFSKINAGNAISIPLGLNFGWAAELNLEHMFEKIFDGSFGEGYPPQDAERKKKDTQNLKQMKRKMQKRFVDLFNELDASFFEVLFQNNIYTYLLENGNEDTKELADLKERLIKAE